MEQLLVDIDEAGVSGLGSAIERIDPGAAPGVQVDTKMINAALDRSIRYTETSTTYQPITMHNYTQQQEEIYHPIYNTQYHNQYSPDI